MQRKIPHCRRRAGGVASCRPSSTELGAEGARAPHGTGSRLLFASNRRAAELDQAPAHASPRRSQPPGFQRRLPGWEQAQDGPGHSHSLSLPAYAGTAYGGSSFPPSRQYEVGKPCRAR
jgi:hypothetical protein